MKKIGAKIRLFIVAVIIACLLVYGFWPSPIQVDTITVQQRSLTVTVDDDGETWHVYRIRNSRAELTPVAIGLSNRYETEIREGLKQGDFVIPHPTAQVISGARVKWPREFESSNLTSPQS